MNRRVVVFGSRGMLGYAVTSHFERAEWEVCALSRDDFDIATADHVLLKDIIRQDDIVVNCAGVIKPQIAKSSIEHVLRVNAVFPRNLAKVCDKLGAKCFHVTTDCVYSGLKGEYTEQDLFDANDLYGMSKNAGDIADCMVLRTSIIGEEKGQSRSLLEWARSQAGKEVNGFTNHRWNGVTTLYFAQIVQRIADHDLYSKGLYHLHSPNTVTKLELVQTISEIYELGLQIKPLEAPEACDRSLGSLYPLSRRVATHTIAQQIAEMRDFFKT